MKVSSIVSVPAFNVSRAVIDGSSYKKGTSEELASSMLQHAWDETSSIGIRTPTEDELVIVADYLNLELERLTALDGGDLAYNLTISYDESDKAVKTQVTNAMLLQEFKETYFNKDGSLRSLNKIQVTVYGHHRTHMLLVANIARANNGLKRIEPKTIAKTYSDEDGWREACMKENAQRERAATPITAIDLLRQAKEIRDAGYPESRHRKQQGNKKIGSIQRAWRFLKLDVAFPDENLYGRAMLKEDNKNVIPFKSLCKERLKTLLNTDENGNSATCEEVMAYINKPLDKANKPLTMVDLKTAKESTPNAMLKALLTDISTGKRGSITFLNSNSTLYNAVHKSLPDDAPILSIDEAVTVLQAAIVSLQATKVDLEG